MEMKCGMLARAKAGHDKGRVYVIIDLDQSYVYLADGIGRKLAFPKKKKKKHIQMICRKCRISEADDDRIAAFIKKYEKEITPTFRED